MKRRITVLILAVGAALYACANPSAPPGGPPDVVPPHIIKILPANGSIGAKPKQVLFQFDEVVSETPKTGNSLAALVFISPKSGDPSVTWHRSAIEVRPKKGWKPNTVYSVTLASGVADLRGNVVDSATRLVFSTGGPIPSTIISGVAFDWQFNKGAARAIVEAIAPDSTTYQTIADSAGRYRLEYVPMGPYVLRAFVDRNNNRMLDPLEPWDTSSTTLTTTATAEFYAFAHDTIGLRIQDVAVIDSGTKLRVTFDKPVLLTQSFIPPQFALKRADSTLLQVAVVLTGPQRIMLDSIQRKNTADSAARAAAAKDTNPAQRAQRDSAIVRATRDSIARAERAVREAARLAALRQGRAAPVIDTTPLPKMHRPQLFTEIFLILEKPLEFETSYRLTANNVRSISGTSKSPNRAFRTGKAPPKDSTAKDSTAKRKTP